MELGQLLGDFARRLRLPPPQVKARLYTSSPPWFLWEEAEPSWDENCSMIQYVQASAPREPRPPRWGIIAHNEEHGKMHYSCFWTCQCQRKTEMEKYHGSTHLSALCSPNSERKVTAQENMCKSASTSLFLKGWKAKLSIHIANYLLKHRALWEHTKC